MAARNRIPPQLEKYLQLPPALSLIVLTSTLDCTTSWLTTRFIRSLLDTVGPSSHESIGGRKDTPIVFLSWLHDLTFWKNECRRTVGVDLGQLIEVKRFAFVDLLSKLAQTPPDQAIPRIEGQVKQAIAALENNGLRDVCLILDGPDLLLSLNLASAFDLNQMILRLRSAVHATIIAASGDLPFVAAAASDARPSSTTPIGVESAQFLISQAHNARFVMSVRGLLTGAAKDVSGVLRVTNGGSSLGLESSGNGSREDELELEARYLVQRDGSVKVYEAT